MIGARARGTVPGLTPPAFAIVGTGRCGTGYLAEAVTAGGVHCGHERWWTPTPGRCRSGLDGDSSWLALPDIEIGCWSGPVVHLVRHPVAVVVSLVGIGFFTGAARREFVQFALTHEPELAVLPELEACVEWWVRWNERCAAVADATVRVEDLPARLNVVADTIGCRLDVDTARRVPSTVNHRRRGEVDETAVWRLLAGRAEQFGYRGDTCG